MQEVRHEITKEQYEKAKDMCFGELYDYANNRGLHPDFIGWWVYGIYGLWVALDPADNKYYLYGNIGDSCD